MVKGEAMMLCTSCCICHKQDVDNRQLDDAIDVVCNQGLAYRCLTTDCDKACDYTPIVAMVKSFTSVGLYT